MSHLWMIFGERYGVPKWHEEGFAVPPPDLPAPQPFTQTGPGDLKQQVAPTQD